MSDFVASTRGSLPQFVGHNLPFETIGECFLWRQPSSLAHAGRYSLSLDEHCPHYRRFPIDHRHHQTPPYDRPSIIEFPHARSMYTGSNISLSFDASSSSMYNDFHKISCSVSKFFQGHVRYFVHVIHRISRVRAGPHIARPVTQMPCHQ